MKKSMQCHIRVNNNSKDQRHVTNLMMCTLEMPNYKNKGDLSGHFDIQWYRSCNTEMLPIENACSVNYLLCADDIGSMIQVGIISKANKDVKEHSTMIGPIMINKKSSEMIHECLEKMSKHDIEFQLVPDPTDATTMALLSTHLQKSKTLVLHLNRQKVKIRNNKNTTVQKESYSTGMRVKLHAIGDDNTLNEKQSSESAASAAFTIWLKQGPQAFKFLAKSSFERDTLAILLRTYCQQLKSAADQDISIYQHVRAANEASNLAEINGGTGPAGEKTLSNDENLISKMLEPYSKNRSPAIGSASAAAAGRKATLSTSASGVSRAPGDAEASVSNASWGDDGSTNASHIDELFPSFDSNELPANPNQPKTKSHRSAEYNNVANASSAVNTGSVTRLTVTTPPASSATITIPATATTTSTSTATTSTATATTTTATATTTTTAATANIANASAMSTTSPTTSTRAARAPTGSNRNLEPVAADDANGGADTASEGGGELQLGEDEADKMKAMHNTNYCLMDKKKNNNHRSGAWKRMEFIDASQAKIATEEDLAKVALDMAPAPVATSTRKKKPKKAIAQKNGGGGVGAGIGGGLAAAKGEDTLQIENTVATPKSDVSADEPGSNGNISDLSAVAGKDAINGITIAIAAPSQIDHSDDVKVSTTATEVDMVAATSKDIESINMQAPTFNVTAKVLDRIDCVLENGKVLKFHTAGSLAISVSPIPTKDILFDIKVVNLDQAIAVEFIYPKKKKKLIKSN
ncbi:spore coat protein sp96 [Reticulomyxa filosa]|uniref:Spore coat protein sp96 n=1 Tax=Reticulomyxa filosa TaxID=46433 RepID=X6N2B5_RETFI|nr:spore coat protein sp96 [Reticulomyxa filosa]|eukprot:ETO19447.1 spore coat protein sp96 [Reticulomyxa filosa]